MILDKWIRLQEAKSELEKEKLELVKLELTLASQQALQLQVNLPLSTQNSIHSYLV